MYNSTTNSIAVHITAEKKKSKKAGTGGFEPPYLGLAEERKKKQQTGWGIWTDALSRIERSTAEPKANVEISCRLREGNFEKSSLAEFGCFTGIFVLQTMNDY